MKKIWQPHVALASSSLAPLLLFRVTGFTLCLYCLYAALLERLKMHMGNCHDTD